MYRYLFYKDVTYNYKGLWIHFTGLSDEPVKIMVQDDFGNLVSVQAGTLKKIKR